MAFYWRSPYKAVNHLKESSLQRTENNLIKKSGQKQLTYASNQDWFNWPKKNNISKCIPSRETCNAAFIKGILKTPGDIDGSRISHTSDSVISAKTNSTSCKGNHKKVTFCLSEDSFDHESVTFGLSEDSFDHEGVYASYKTRCGRSTSTHKCGMGHIQFLQELSRHTFKNLPDCAVDPASLLRVDETNVQTTNYRYKPSLAEPVCLHRSELRCDCCFQENEHNYYQTDHNDLISNQENESSSENLADDSKIIVTDVNCSKKLPAQPLSNAETSSKVAAPLSIHHQTDKEKQMETMKKYTTYRLKYFQNSQLRKNGLFQQIVGRCVRSASLPPTPLSCQLTIKLDLNNSRFADEHFRKLYSTKIGANQTNRAAFERQNDELGSNRCAEIVLGSIPSLTPALSGDRFSDKMPSALTLADIAFARNNMAKCDSSRRKFKYNSSSFMIARNDTEIQKCLDKTSQLLAWLKDVKQKEKYKPRNARFYASDLQKFR